MRRFHQASVAENAQVFGDLRLTKTQAMDHVTDGARAGAQEFDDMKTVGFCQSFERAEHDWPDMPDGEYACQGIFPSGRRIAGEQGQVCELDCPKPVE